MAMRRTNDRIEWLLGQLLEHGYRLDQRGAASQLSYSSFDSAPGAGIKETDPETGNVVANFGTQFDGSHGAVIFTGPDPDQPSPPVYEVAPAVLTGGWDGVFCQDGTPDPTIPPKLDFTHVEVHASKVSGYAADTAETLIGTINTPRGGYVTAAVGAGTWYLRLVARSAAGKRSVASSQVEAVVPATVDVAPIQQELEDANTAIEAAAAEAADAIAAATAALGTANGASTAASNAAAAAATADSKAAAAQSTATNAATAASTADGKAAAAQTAATNAATAASTADGKAVAAQTAAANAAKKITVSTAVPSGTGNPGDLWYQKNGTAAAAAIIGMWEWATAPTPAGWKVRTTDGGVISNMSVVNLVAGSGTMATGVIDKIFSDVVVAKTAVISTAFIGTNAIITGAITAPKITASEELTAKVAQFLEVNADMINTNSLWADTAWIAAARAHIIEVLQYTNGEGYTSKITGQGLRVTKQVNGQQVDVIRLGTFGKDFVSVSDGSGIALASITGDGEMGTQSLYADGDVYSNGKKLGDAFGDLAKGEKVYGSHMFTAGNTPATWSTVSTTGAGIIEVAFEAEPGRAYQLVGNAKWWPTAAAAKASFQAVYAVGIGVPTVSSTNKITAPGNGVETPLVPVSTWTSVDFGGRFIPNPLTSTSTVQGPIRCRVLLWVKRTSGTGTINVEYAEMQVNDMGFPGHNYVGFPNGTGTSTLPAAVTTTETFVPEEVIRWQASAPDSATFSPVTPANNVDPFKVGDVDATGRGWKAAVLFPANSWLTARNAATIATQMRIRIKPTLFPQGMGTIHFGVAGYRSVTAPAPTDGSWNTPRQLIAGAWPAGVTREFVLPEQFIQWYIRTTTTLMWWFGGTTPDAGINRDPRYATLINPADIQLIVTTTKKV